MLINRIGYHLDNQSGIIPVDKLLEGLYMLKISSLNERIRKRMLNTGYRRSAKDISTSFLFFTESYK